MTPAPAVSSRRGAALVAALALLLGLGVALPAPAAAQEYTWQWYDADGNGYTDTAVSVYPSGLAGQLWQDTDANGQWDLMHQWDTTGAPRWVWLDTNHNGTWDTFTELTAAGYIRAVLSNTRTEFDGLWDSVLDAGTGSSWYDQCGITCGGNGWSVAYHDTVYRMTWRGRSYDPMVLGGIRTQEGHNYLLTLAKTFQLAGAMHCYNYRTSPSSQQYCRERGWY